MSVSFRLPRRRRVEQSTSPFRLQRHQYIRSSSCSSSRMFILHLSSSCDTSSLLLCRNCYKIGYTIFISNCNILVSFLFPPTYVSAYTVSAVAYAELNSIVYIGYFFKSYTTFY